MNVPWLPFLATKFLETLDLQQCFEWGSGGSTLWLAKRCQYLVSVEHNPERMLSSLPANVETLFRTPAPGEIGADPANPEHYKSGSTEYGNVNWKRYVQAIDAYGEFDLILVDGAARASCIAHAVPHVKPGGWLVIDNTGDRPWYLVNNMHLFGNWNGGWDRVTFFGRGPTLSYLWETTMFRRPE